MKRACVVAAVALALSVLCGMAPAQAASTPGSTYFPLTPSRLLDTRDGTGAPQGPLGPGGTLDLTVWDAKGVPGSGVTAVVLNVTATDATAQHSYLTVYPAGTIRPVASNLNVSAGRTSTNMVTVAVPSTGFQAGKVTIYNNLGTVSVVADVNGWYSANGGAVGATYHPLAPRRIFDTRYGDGVSSGVVFGGQTIDVQVTGVGGVPDTGVSAVVLNVTAIHRSGPESFLTVYPSGADRPLASNLNFLDRRIVPNLVIAPVGDGGAVSMFNNMGLAHIVADVQGWYTSTGTTTGATYFPLSPARDLDTRTGVGTGGTIGRLTSDKRLDLAVTGVNGVPESGVAAVVLNLTAVDATTDFGQSSWLTIFPGDTDHGPTSNLNFVDGQTIANMVMARVAADGTVSIYIDVAASADVVADVQGWFLPYGA